MFKLQNVKPTCRFECRLCRRVFGKSEERNPFYHDDWAGVCNHIGTYVLLRRRRGAGASLYLCRCNAQFSLHTQLFNEIIAATKCQKTTLCGRKNWAAMQWKIYICTYLYIYVLFICIEIATGNRRHMEVFAPARLASLWGAPEQEISGIKSLTFCRFFSVNI